MTIIAIIIGAAIGAPLRYLVDSGVTHRVGSSPIAWGLLTVNIVGSAIAGVVLATTDGNLRLLLTVGFCGAFTTFSGFGWEANRQWSTSRPAFWLTIIVMPLACTAAFALCWTILR